MNSLNAAILVHGLLIIFFPLVLLGALAYQYGIYREILLKKEAELDECKQTLRDVQRAEPLQRKLDALQTCCNQLADRLENQSKRETPAEDQQKLAEAPPKEDVRPAATSEVHEPQGSGSTHSDAEVKENGGKESTDSSGEPVNAGEGAASPKPVSPQGEAP